MEVKIILNGGLKTCCSQYPTELIRETVDGWISDLAKVEVIDREETSWEPDEVADLALKYFNDQVYPLVYLGDSLAVLGRLPDRDTFRKMIKGEVSYGATTEDIIKAARRYGLIQE